MTLLTTIFSFDSRNGKSAHMTKICVQYFFELKHSVSQEIATCLVFIPRLRNLSHMPLCGQLCGFNN